MRRGGGVRHSPTAHSPAAPQRPRPQAVPRRCPGGLCGGGNPGLAPRAPHQRWWPGGAGRRGRGDIIRAAPPLASTAPQARRSIHDIIGLISTPLPPTPQQRDAPPPQLRSRRRSLAAQRARGWVKRRGAPRRACFTYSWLQGPARGLRSRSHRPGSLAQPKARPAGRAARARLRSAPLPLPARPRPPAAAANAGPPLATPPGAANPRAGAGLGALTLWLLNPCPRLGPAPTR